MQDLFASAVRRMRANLLARIGTEVPVRFGDVSYIPHGEIADQFLDEGQAIFVRFEILPSGLLGVLSVDGALLSRLMGLMLGEDPWAPPTPFIWRPPTRMDLHVTQRIAEDVFAGLMESLPSKDPMSIRILDVSGSNRVDLPYPRTALLLDATLDFGPPEDPYGLMTLALPLAFASAVWPEVNTTRSPTAAGLQRVMPLQIPVVAELARITMSFARLEDLKVGDTIPLGAPREVMMAVSGRPVVVGEAGTLDNLRCVRVLRRAR
jgi:flagellar motor switch protein FliM